MMLFLVVLFGSRILDVRAMKNLSNEKKAELIDLFSKSRILNFGLIILFIGTYFLVLKFELCDPTLALTIYLVLMACFLIFNVVKVYKKMKSNTFPNTFISTYLISSTIRVFAILMLFAFLIAGFI